MDPYRTAGEPGEMPKLHDDECWFLCGSRGKKAGPRLVALCEEIQRQQQTLIDNTNMCISVFQYGGAARMLDPEEHCAIDDETLVYNAAQNAVETVHAKVFKSRIALMPLTNGGGYLARHRAKEMEKAIEAIYDENDGEVIEEEVGLDALVTDHGAGAVIVDELRDRVGIRHIAIEDVWYDEAETRLGRPTCCYFVPKDGEDVYRAIELFANPLDDDRPGFVGTAASRRQAIIDAAKKPATWRRESKTSYRVDFFEGWHPPTCREEYDEEYEEDEDDEEGGKRIVKKTRKVVKHDGRHVVAVSGENGTLVDEPWDGAVPILLYVPRRRRRHVFGLSLMRNLLAPQREYERITAKIQHEHQKMGVSGWSAHVDARLNPREITSGTKGAGFVMEWEGQAEPKPIVTEPVAMGTLQYAESIPRNMLERHGISTLAAASQLPAGLQQASGKAMQVFEDFEDVRLMPYHRARERFRVALGWLIIETAKRIVDRVGSYKVHYRGKRGLEPIDWATLVDLVKDKESFGLRVFPISQLSKQPAARFAQLTELLNAQAITVEQFKRLFELPDLEAESQLDTADTDIIDRNMDIMVTTGRYLSPEPFDNLDLIISRAGKFINVCRQQDVPEARIKLLHDYIEDAKGLKQQIAEAEAAKQAAAAPPVDAGMPPGGAPPPEAGPPPGMPMAA